MPDPAPVMTATFPAKPSMGTLSLVTVIEASRYPR
jgi:hypothetical protein